MAREHGFSDVSHTIEIFGICGECTARRFSQSPVAIYEAFNSDGVSVVVSDVDLDQAARDDGPLSTELADAAAQARRTDLVEHLHRSLDGDERARKLAAAKALLALDDRSAGALLESLAASEPDTVVAKSFTAVATRLRGSTGRARLVPQLLTPTRSSRACWCPTTTATFGSRPVTSDF